MGGYIVGVKLLGVEAGSYWNGMEASVVWEDISMGLVKSLFFGLIITWVCTSRGFFCTPGPLGRIWRRGSEPGHNGCRGSIFRFRTPLGLPVDSLTIVRIGGLFGCWSHRSPVGNSMRPVYLQRGITDEEVQRRNGRGHVSCSRVSLLRLSCRQAGRCSNFW